METFALAVQVLLAAVFATAGIAKLLDPPGSRRALADFGVPDGLTSAGAVVLPLAELGTAAALLPPQTARVAALLGLVLLVAFIAGITRALLHGQAPDCHCFGQVHSAPAGRATLARNAVLAALAGFLAVRGPGPALDDWTGARSAAVLVAIGSGLAAILLAAAAIQLWRETRRLRRDVATLRAASEALPPGLPVGTHAPGFSLPGVHGETLTLDSLRGRGQPVALVFAEPACGPCRRLFPYLGRWQATLADRVTIAVVTSGSVLENRATAQEHELANVLLQQESEVMDAYRIRATPAAVVVSPDGHVASGPAAGEFEVEELIRLTLHRHAQAPTPDEALS